MWGVLSVCCGCGVSREAELKEVYCGFMVGVWRV